jgi:hypothetical protein
MLQLIAFSVAINVRRTQLTAIIETRRTYSENVTNTVFKIL